MTAPVISERHLLTQGERLDLWLFRHVQEQYICTHSFLICSTWSMVMMPAQVKFSLYWLILMDSSHSDTDLKGEPSEPLVLGRRMDTLRNREKNHGLLIHYLTEYHCHLSFGEREGRGQTLDTHTNTFPKPQNLMVLAKQTQLYYGFAILFLFDVLCVRLCSFIWRNYWWEEKPETIKPVRAVQKSDKDTLIFTRLQTHASVLTHTHANTHFVWWKTSTSL